VNGRYLRATQEERACSTIPAAALPRRGSLRSPGTG
jgi:hypothetical protein